MLDISNTVAPDTNNNQMISAFDNIIKTFPLLSPYNIYPNEGKLYCFTRKKIKKQ